MEHWLIYECEEGHTFGFPSKLFPEEKNEIICPICDSEAVTEMGRYVELYTRPTK